MKYFLLLLFVLMHFNSFAQNADYTLTEPHRTMQPIVPNHAITIVGENSKKILTFHLKSDTLKVVYGKPSDR